MLINMAAIKLYKISAPPSPKTGSGINNPLLFRKNESANSKLCFGFGNALSTAKYQKKI